METPIQELAKLKADMAALAPERDALKAEVATHTESIKALTAERDTLKAEHAQALA